MKVIFSTMHYPDSEPFLRYARGDVDGFELLMFTVGLVWTVWFVWKKIIGPALGWLWDKAWDVIEPWTAVGRSQRAETDKVVK